MIEILYQGGPYFTGTQTLFFLIIMATAVYMGVKILKKNIRQETHFRQNLKLIRSLGLFTLVFGIGCSLFGLFMAFDAIAEVGTVSMDLLAGGLKVTLIPVIYGVSIYLTSFLIWLGLDIAAQKIHASGVNE